MPVIQEVADLERVHDTLSNPPIYLNDLPSATEADRIHIRDLIASRFSGDMFSLLPSCMCGACKGEHYHQQNHVCPHCQHPVVSQITQSIESQVWIRQPDGCEPLLNPQVMAVLMERFKKAGVNVIQYIIDPTYSLGNRKVTPLIRRVQELFPRRGYNYFVQNYDEILQTLLSMGELRKTRASAPDPHREFLYANRHLTFTRYLPVPNRSLLYFEEAAVGKYVYDSILDAIDVLSTLASIDRDYYDQRPEQKANRTGKCLLRLAEFYRKYRSDYIGRKQGMIRKQLLASRATWTGRMVVTALCGPHKSDQIVIPWIVAIGVWQHHIAAELMSRMPLNMVHGKIRRAMRIYDPEIAMIMQSFIDEAKHSYDGVPVIVSRPPKLLQSSAVRCYIIGFTHDPTELTMQVSARLCPSLNA